MTANRSPTAIVAVIPAPESDGADCHCFCLLTHDDQRGICAGHLAGDGVRVHYASLWNPRDGVPVCRPCIDAHPTRRNR